MASRSDSLLRAISTALELSETSTLDPEHTTSLGRSLGLAPEQTIEVVEQLQAAELIRIAWGGRITLTEKGRRSAVSESGGEKAGVVQHLNISGGNFGPTQFGPNSTMDARQVSITPPALAGDLAVALEQLRQRQAELNPQELEVTKQLEGEIQGVIEEARKETPDKATLEQKLERTRGVLDQLAGVGEAARKLGPTLALIGRYVGTLGLPGM